MIEGLKPYPAYKESDVDWLGRVPEHWEVRRIKSISSVKRGASPRPIEDPKYFDGSGEYSWVRISDVTASVRYLERTKDKLSELGKALSVPLEPGSLFLSIAGSVGKPIITRVKCCIHDGFVYFPDFKGNAEFLYRIFASGELYVGLGKLGTQLNLNTETVGSIRVGWPPSVEQDAIVKFVDAVDVSIRRYIRAKQKLIKLLEEQKQAIIHRAVTCGLDPNVRLKPSGVEWLGDVPEHWEVRRNGRLFAQRQETGFPELPILEVSLRTGVRVRNFDASDRKQVMFDRSQYKRALRGDIAYNMMRMWQGAVGVAPVDGLVSPAYVVARPLEGTETRYFHRLFRTVEYMSEIDAFSRGIVKDRNRLYWEDFKQMPSPYPPAAEQSQIADAIDEEVGAIEIAVSKVHREIELLREYRTRLIADVVTGKLDVREAAARLPDEPDAFVEESAEEIMENDLDELETAVEEEVEA
jgi:type I restriction enzyme S subunit